MCSFHRKKSNVATSKINIEDTFQDTIDIEQVVGSSNFIEVNISGPSRSKLNKDAKEVDCQEDRESDEEIVECDGMSDDDDELIESRNAIRAFSVRKNQRQKDVTAGAARLCP